ncbi:MAG: hypothetical protein JSW58_08960 [Candidatus Latescibacterota bacterium]|nr:MAG: hypothetical protein JSW58_08960 [Candidatus Latescibacterota bacterium]
MEDALFLAKLNEIARENRLKLPILTKGELPPSDFLDDWAKFLESCVRKGITLSDDRWLRVAVASKSPHAVFSLDEEGHESVDPDFRVGLQLLMGLLEDQNDNQD